MTGSLSGTEGKRESKPIVSKKLKITDIKKLIQWAMTGLLCEIEDKRGSLRFVL